MPRLITGAWLCLALLPGCIPRYMMGAQATVAVVSMVASEVAPKEPEVPSRASEILDMDKGLEV